MKTFENKLVKVFWDKEKCIHAGQCTDGLPTVFDPERQPWIDVDAATAEEIMKVIDRCPSGALSYEAPGKMDQPKGARSEVTVRVSASGPYLVSGSCHLISCDGRELKAGTTFALCRCGHSRTMPFCDGSHRRVGYKEPSQEEMGPK